MDMLPMIPVRRKPKQIMIAGITNINVIKGKLSSGDMFDFEDKIH